VARKKPKPKGKAGRKNAKSKRRIRVNYPLVGGAAAVALAAVWLFYPTYQVRLEQERQLAAVKREYARMRAENDTLRFRIKQIQSPEYVERYAREKLGLIKPGENAYVVLPPSRSRSATKTPTRVARPVVSTEPTSAWESVKAFFGGLFGR